MLATRFSNSFPSLFDRFFDDDMMDWSNSNYSTTNTTLPRVNIKETKDDYVIEVAAPGMKKDDFKINYDNGKLSISSEVESKSNPDVRYTRHEFSYQSFKRTFDVPRELVDAEKISAKYEDGILCMTLPKREEIKPKPAKQISIS